MIRCHITQLKAHFVKINCYTSTATATKSISKHHNRPHSGTTENISLLLPPTTWSLNHLCACHVYHVKDVF